MCLCGSRLHHQGGSLWPCYQRTWHHMGKGVLHGTCPSIRTLAPLWSNSVRAYTAPGRGRGVTGRWGPQPGCVLLQKQHWICCISHAYFCRQAAPGIEALRPTHNRSLRLRRLSCTAAAEAAAWVVCSIRCGQKTLTSLLLSESCMSAPDYTGRHLRCCL